MILYLFPSISLDRSYLLLQSAVLSLLIILTRPLSSSLSPSTFVTTTFRASIYPPIWDVSNSDSAHLSSLMAMFLLATAKEDILSSIWLTYDPMAVRFESAPIMISSLLLKSYQREEKSEGWEERRASMVDCRSSTSGRNLKIKGKKWWRI